MLRVAARVPSCCHSRQLGAAVRRAASPLSVCASCTYTVERVSPPVRSCRAFVTGKQLWRLHSGPSRYVTAIRDAACCGEWPQRRFVVGPPRLLEVGRPQRTAELAAAVDVPILFQPAEVEARHTVQLSGLHSRTAAVRWNIPPRAARKPVRMPHFFTPAEQTTAGQRMMLNANNITAPTWRL